MGQLGVILSMISSFFVAFIIGVTYYVIKEPEVINPEESTELGKYFQIRKDSLINSLKNTEFLNISNYITNKQNPSVDFNRVLNEHHYILIPKDFHFILSEEISIPNNSIIKFEEMTTLFTRTPINYTEANNCLFSFNAVTNATFIGNGMKIFMNRENVTGDFPLFCIRGSSNILIMDFGIFNSPSEAIIISGSNDKPYSENIAIKNVNIENSKKGIRIESVRELKASKITVRYSYNKNDSGAIKISGRNSNSILENIYLDQLVTERNQGSGLEIDPKVNKLTLTIKGYESRHDGGRAPIYLRNSPNNGKIIFSNLAISNDQLVSMIFMNWNTKDCAIDVMDPKLNWKAGFLYGIDEEDMFYTNLDLLNIQR